jgi:hypothetical protein
MPYSVPANPNQMYGVRGTNAAGNFIRKDAPPLQGEKSMLRPSPLSPDAPQTPSGSAAKKAGTRYAPAGTAKATGKGTRGVPRPTPRSNFKPATGGKSTSTPSSGKPPLSGERTSLRPTPLAPSRVPNSPSGPMTGDRTALRPTPLNPKYQPGPLGRMPQGAGPLNPVPGPLGRTTFPAPQRGFVGKVNDFLTNLGKRGTGIKRLDTLVQAGEMLDRVGGQPYRQHMAAHPEDKNMTPMQLSTHIRESKLAPAATPAPAASGGNKPAGGTSQKPSGPAYFPEAGRNGSAVRTPDSYLGEAFDYSLQKGTNSGTKYLEHMFRRDKVSEDDQQRLRERFNKKVVGDKTLSEYGANQGITKTLEGKKSGLGEALLGKYRDTGTYKGNTDYDVMRAAAEARMARK